MGLTHNELKDIIKERAGWLGESDILRLRNITIDNEPAIRVKCSEFGRTRQLIDKIFSGGVVVHDVHITYKDSGNLFTVRKSDVY